MYYILATNSYLLSLSQSLWSLLFKYLICQPPNMKSRYINHSLLLTLFPSTSFDICYSPSCCGPITHKSQDHNLTFVERVLFGTVCHLYLRGNLSPTRTNLIGIVE